MLTLITSSGPVLIQDTEYYIRQLASGLDEAIFQISVYDPIYKALAEEMQVVDRNGQTYLIKQVDGGAELAKVICQVDVDAWKARLLLDYGSASNTLYNTINAIKPTGWTVVDETGLTYRRTIEGNLTPFEIVQAACDTFGAYPRWDTKAKTLTLKSRTMPAPVGAFATRELNLKEIQYKGKSNTFATRLYAYGKEGLSFASINGGKEYVDDNTYSSKIVCAYWKDERYTIKENLLADARAKLAGMAVPQRIFDCSVVDLQATDPAKYAAFDFALLSSAVLIDDLKGAAITYQILERDEYPYHPELNRVVFNNAVATITGDIITVADSVVNPNSAYNQGIASSIDSAQAAAEAAAEAYADGIGSAAEAYTDAALRTAKEYADNATDWLTSGQGYIVAVQNADGTWKELLFMDRASTQTAQKVLRINENGLGFSSTGVGGPYTQAWTLDGRLIIGGTNTVTLAAYDGSENVLFSVDKSGIAWDLPASRMTKSGTQYFLGVGATASSGNVIRISAYGIAFSTTGWNGPYTQAWNINGQLTIGGSNNVQLRAVNGSGTPIFTVNQSGISWSLPQSIMQTSGLLYFLGSGATATRGNVLRISSAGIAFSRNGYNGTYAQSWTIDGIMTLGGNGNKYGLLRILNSKNLPAVEASDGVLELYSYDANGIKQGEANLYGDGLDLYGPGGMAYAMLSPGVLSVDDGESNTATYAASYMDITAGGYSMSLTGEMLSIDTIDASTITGSDIEAGNKLTAADLEVYNQIDCGSLYINGEEITPTPALPEGITDTIFADGNILYFEDGILVEVDSD